MRTWALVVALLGVVSLVACGAGTPKSLATPTPLTIANPASTYCVKQGFRSEIRTASDGSQVGVCVFSDGTECDEWAYYRGQCAPGTRAAPAATSAVSPRTPQATAPAIVDQPGPVEGWVGRVVKLPAGNQFGQYFEREDGQRFDIGAQDSAVMEQIQAAAREGLKVRVWGILSEGVPAGQARHIEVQRIEPSLGSAS